MLENNENKQIYKICDDFINIRLNNSFVDCNKNSKIKFLSLWTKYLEHINKENITELMFLTKGIVPQVVSDTYCLFITTSESIKIVANSKLYDIEVSFNSHNNTEYKMIFISKHDWDDFMKSYDKSKKYELMDETAYINNNKNAIKLAEETFGNDLINIK